MAVTAIGATIVTVIATCLLAATLTATRKAAIYTRGMLREAKATTKAAQKQLAHADDTARKQLRAYVGVTHAMGEEFKNAVIYRFRVKNYGQTPAYKLTLTLWRAFGVKNRNTDTILVKDNGNDLMPGGDYTVDVIVTPEEDAEIQAESRVLWVYGEGTYADAFGEEWPVRANFRLGKPPEK